jgi:hypothetical protein
MKMVDIRLEKWPPRVLHRGVIAPKSAHTRLLIEVLHCCEMIINIPQSCFDHFFEIDVWEEHL